jgi:hypothetical protein
MDRAEYYDLLVKTSKDGGFPSYAPLDKHCKYHSEDGKKCAAGLLISDKVYDPEMENIKISSVIEKYNLGKIIPKGLSLKQLQDIQFAHDEIALCNEKWDHESFVVVLTNIFRGK